MNTSDAPIESALAARLARFPVERIATSAGTIGVRSAGRGRPVVMLHGIGSGSGSWLHQYERLGDDFRLIGWDAPGYGLSTPLHGEAPDAVAYADALARLFDALGLSRALVVGQSLGGIMATAFARRHAARIGGLLLLDPARGYGSSAPEERAEKLATRLENMDRLGPAKLAATRSANLLGPNHTPEALELVRMNMAELIPAGHAQAARLLAASDLHRDAAHVRCQVLVACGTEDKVTPEAGVRAIAAAFPAAEYRALPGLGHACYVDGPEQVNALLREFAARLGDWR